MPRRARATKKATGRKRSARAGAALQIRVTVKDEVRERKELAARRAQLIALGIEAFTAQSYDQVSIDEVARKAGISKGLLYHYFPSKKAFYVATLHAAAAQLLDATTPDPSLPPLDRLQRGLDAFLRYAEAHGEAYSALLRGAVSVDEEVFQILEATRARFQSRLLEGLPSGLSGPAVRLLSRGWVSLVETSTLEWVEKKELSRERFRKLLTNSLLAILSSGAV